MCLRIYVLKKRSFLFSEICSTHWGNCFQRMVNRTFQNLENLGYPNDEMCKIRFVKNGAGFLVFF